MAERKRIGVPISGLDISTPDHSVVDGKCETLHNLRYTGEAWRNVKGFENLKGKIDDRAIEATTDFSEDLFFTNFYADWGHYLPKVGSYVYSKDSNTDIVTYIGRVVSFVNDTCTIRHKEGYNMSRKLSNIQLTSLYDGNHSIIYKHEDRYIGYFTQYRDDDVNNDYLHMIYQLAYDNEAKAFYPTNLICSAIFANTNKHLKSIFHFGNMLISRWDNNTPLYFLFRNNQYFPYGNNLTLNFNIEESGSIPSKNVSWSKRATNAGVTTYYSVLTWETVAKQNTDGILLSSIEGDYFRGEFAIFAALRSEDGSVLYRTLPQIYNSSGNGLSVDYGYDLMNIDLTFAGVSGIEIIDKQTYDRLEDVTEDGVTIRPGIYYHPDYGKLKKVRIFFEGNIKSEEVYDIAFYSTRLYPLVTGDWNNLRCSPADLMQEPFYLLKTIRINDIENNSSSFIIDANLIANVEHQPTFKATIGNLLYSDNVFEYNNRVHLLSPTIFQQKQPTNVLKIGNKENSIDTTYLSHLILRSKYDTKELYSTIPARDGVENSNIAFYDKNQGPLISFFGEITNAFIANWGREYSNDFRLKYSPSLDLSYYMILGETGTIKYTSITLNENKIGDISANVDTESSSVTSPNRLQVSELNNPYIFPFENSYRIGSSKNEIIALNSGAIEMSDSKFGEFPLYVFTKEGIYAMQSGKETLYSAIIPINYDVIINPNTLAVNGAVLYFTDKGLHALTNQGAKLLSAPIHTVENRIPEWMYTTQMVYLPEWNEVLCTDLPNRKAYVFSLDSNVWSTRDIPEGYILNNDELVSTDDKIYNLRNEKEQGSDGVGISLTTRPIKLGSMELKRAETIIVRFECPTEQTLNVEVEGSIDTQNWKTLRKLEGVQTNKDIVIRRTPCSVKYLRFKIDGNVTDDIRILAFEIEYYNRWMRKMR